MSMQLKSDKIRNEVNIMLIKEKILIKIKYIIIFLNNLYCHTMMY